ncbi:MAG: hypothetical protein WD066_19425 [Planctomycetaceae bacterium]
MKLIARRLATRQERIVDEGPESYRAMISGPWQALEIETSATIHRTIALVDHELAPVGGEAACDEFPRCDLFFPGRLPTGTYGIRIRLIVDDSYYCIDSHMQLPEMRRVAKARGGRLWEGTLHTNEVIVNCRE